MSAAANMKSPEVGGGAALSEDMDDPTWQARSVFVSNLPDSHRTGGMVFGMVKRIGTVTSIRNGSSGTDNPHFTIISFLMPQAAREAADMLKKPTVAIPPGLETSAVTPGHVDFARGRVGRAFTPKSTLPISRQIQVNTGPEAAPKPGQNAHRSAVNPPSATLPVPAQSYPMSSSGSSNGSDNRARSPSNNSHTSSADGGAGPRSPNAYQSGFPRGAGSFAAGPPGPYHQPPHPPPQIQHQYQQQQQQHQPSQHLLSPPPNHAAPSFSRSPHHQAMPPPPLPQSSGYNGAPPPPHRSLQHQPSREFRPPSAEPSSSSHGSVSFPSSPHPALPSASSASMPVYPLGSNLAPNPQAPPFVPSSSSSSQNQNPSMNNQSLAPRAPSPSTTSSIDGAPPSVELLRRLDETEAKLAAATAAAQKEADELAALRKLFERKERDQEAELAALRRRLEEAKRDVTEGQMRAGSTQRLVERLAKDDDKIALSLALIENLAHRARLNPGPAGVLPPVPPGFDLSRLDHQPDTQPSTSSSSTTSPNRTTTTGSSSLLRSDSTRKRARSPSPPPPGSSARLTSNGSSATNNKSISPSSNSERPSPNRPEAASSSNNAVVDESVRDTPSVRKSARLSVDGRGMTASGSLSSLSTIANPPPTSSSTNEHGQRIPSSASASASYDSDEPRLPPRLRGPSGEGVGHERDGSSSTSASGGSQYEGREGGGEMMMMDDGHGGRNGMFSRVKKAFGR